MCVGCFFLEKWIISAYAGNLYSANSFCSDIHLVITLMIRVLAYLTHKTANFGYVAT